MALKTYVKKGYELSTKVFHTLTCLHPNLAFGFHCLSRLRIGAFLDLADVRQLAAHSYAVFSNTEKDVDNSAVDRCPCCKKPRMHDTAGHFIFVCGTGLAKQAARNPPDPADPAASKTGLLLEALRSAPVDRFGRLMADDEHTGSPGGKLSDVRDLVEQVFLQKQDSDQNFRWTRTCVSKDQAVVLMAGGHEITVGIGPAARATEGNLQQHYWEPEGEAAKELVRCVLGKNTKGKGHSVQRKHRLFELGATALARYLQSAMPARNAALWRSCDSEEKIVGPAAHKSKQPQAVGQG